MPIADIADVSVTKDKAGIDFLFSQNLTVSSVDKCCASAALPPFPKKIIFFPFFKDFTQMFTRFKKFLSTLDFVFSINGVNFRTF